MNQLLTINEKIKNIYSGNEYIIEKFLGGGGQGEVYQVKLGEKKLALKWYFPKTATEEQRINIEKLVKKGPPNKKFLWPIEIVKSEQVKGFGYIMELRPQSYKSIVDLMKRKVEATFKAIANASIELADSFYQLHSNGLCYRDISFGNIFIEPNNGTVLICDNDNVTIDNNSNVGVLGTPRFMAPEVVRGEALPSSDTDLFSLAILLFYMHMLHHPLEGEREANIKCMDLLAMNKLYGEEPIFIFDPNNDTNRPVRGLHDNAIEFWNVYPDFIKKLFIKAFTRGIIDSKNGRVRETEWRLAMLKLKDSIFYCPNCEAENFYDLDNLKENKKHNCCWSCKKEINLNVPRIKINDKIIILNYNTKLYDIHINSKSVEYEFRIPLAEVSQHPNNKKIWGLKNLSQEIWTIKSDNEVLKEVIPGKSIQLKRGLKINFGGSEGEIKL